MAYGDIREMMVRDSAAGGCSGKDERPNACERDLIVRHKADQLTESLAFLLPTAILTREGPCFQQHITEPAILQASWAINAVHGIDKAVRDHYPGSLPAQTQRA